MAYIGVKPTIGNFQICDAISVVNGQAAYTMQVGSVNVSPQSANHMIVSLNGVIQKPGSSYTVSGNTITFASNLATGDVIDFIQILGDVLDLGVPSDATVTAAKLTANSITGQTAETSIATDDTLLIHDTSAGALRKMTRANFVSGVGGTNTPAFHAYNNADQTISANTETQLIFNTEIYDTNSAFASNTFTVPSGEGGRYFVYFRLGFASGNDFTFQVTLKISDAFNADSGFRVNGENQYYNNHFSGQVMNLSAGATLKLYIYTGEAGQNISGTENRANFGAYKIIE